MTTPDGGGGTRRHGGIGTGSVQASPPAAMRRQDPSVAGRGDDAGMTADAVRMGGDGWEAADPSQNAIAARLFRYEPRAKEAYLGALYALQHDGYPDRLAQAAHSMREVIDLLSRLRQAQ